MAKFLKLAALASFAVLSHADSTSMENWWCINPTVADSGLETDSDITLLVTKGDAFLCSATQTKSNTFCDTYPACFENGIDSYVTVRKVRCVEKKTKITANNVSPPTTYSYQIQKDSVCTLPKPETNGVMKPGLGEDTCQKDNIFFQPSNCPVENNSIAITDFVAHDNIDIKVYAQEEDVTITPGTVHDKDNNCCGGNLPLPNIGIGIFVGGFVIARNAVTRGGL